MDLLRKALGHLTTELQLFFFDAWGQELKVQPCRNIIHIIPCSFCRSYFEGPWFTVTRWPGVFQLAISCRKIRFHSVCCQRLRRCEDSDGSRSQQDVPKLFASHLDSLTSEQWKPTESWNSNHRSHSVTSFFPWFNHSSKWALSRKAWTYQTHCSFEVLYHHGGVYIDFDMRPVCTSFGWPYSNQNENDLNGMTKLNKDTHCRVAFFAVAMLQICLSQIVFWVDSHFQYPKYLDHVIGSQGWQWRTWMRSSSPQDQGLPPWFRIFWSSWLSLPRWRKWSKKT